MMEEDFELILDELLPVEQIETRFMIEEINKALEPFDCQADIKRFYPSDLPALYYMNNDVEFIRQAQQAKESSYGIFSDTLSSLISNKCKEVIATVYLNINNSLIEEMLN